MSDEAMRKAGDLMFGRANQLATLRREAAVLSRAVTPVLTAMVDGAEATTPAEIALWTNIAEEDVVQALQALEMVGLVEATGYRRTRSGEAAVGDEGMFGK